MASRVILANTGKSLSLRGKGCKRFSLHGTNFQRSNRVSIPLVAKPVSPHSKLTPAQINSLCSRISATGILCSDCKSLDLTTMKVCVNCLLKLSNHFASPKMKRPANRIVEDIKEIPSVNTESIERISPKCPNNKNKSKKVDSEPTIYTPQFTPVNMDEKHFESEHIENISDGLYEKVHRIYELKEKHTRILRPAVLQELETKSLKLMNTLKSRNKK